MKLLLVLSLFTSSCLAQITLETYCGTEIQPHLKEIRSLSHKIHCESPYLYNGHDAGYDGYLEVFPKSKEAIITVAFDDKKAVGFVAGIPLDNTKKEYHQILVDHAHDPETFFFLGDFGILPEYKERGVAEKLFEQIESYAKACDYSMLCFWEIEDTSTPTQKPPGTIIRDVFWKKVGFTRYPTLYFLVFWTNIHESFETPHLAIYWTKKLS